MNFIHDIKDLEQAKKEILQEVVNEHQINIAGLDKYYDDVLMWMIDHPIKQVADLNGNKYLGILSETEIAGMERKRTLGFGALTAIYYLTVPAGARKIEWEEIIQKICPEGDKLYLIGNNDQRLEINSKWLIDNFVIIHK